MKSVVLNIEANGLKPDKIWCATCIDIDTGEEHVFRRPDELPDPFVGYMAGCGNVVGHNLISYDLPHLDRLVRGYQRQPRIVDTLVVSRLLDYNRAGGHSLEAWAPVVSVPKSVQPPWEEFSEALVEHSLQNCRITLALYKTFLPYLNSPRWKRPIETEHAVQTYLRQMHENGFYLDVDNVVKLRYNILEELEQLDSEILEGFPPRAKLVREVHPRITKFGTLNKSDFRWFRGEDLRDFNGGPFSLIEFEPFNPGSPTQIVERLNEAGWQPTEKTKGHQLALREKDKEKLAKLSKTGWMVSETNVGTLPDLSPQELWLNECRLKIKKGVSNTIDSIIKETQKNVESTQETTTIAIPELVKTASLKESTAFLLTILTECLGRWMDVAKFVESENHLWSIIVTPQDVFVDCSASFATDTWASLRNMGPLPQLISVNKAARLLALRIMLASRARTLKEWIDNYNPETHRVHGNVNGIGAWTGRCSHDRPNTGNIPVPQPVNATSSGMRFRANEIDKLLRTYWRAEPRSYLVGVDAEGIQLRVLAHYINDPRFTHSVISGKKEDGTDPHTLNKGALGSPCKSREDAKTFIYAWLLGAGIGKVAQILGCSHAEAKRANDDFITFYPGLRILKRDQIPSDAARGYFEGFDGRYVSIFGDDQGSREHFCLAGYLQNGETVVMKRAMEIWYPRLVAERIPFKLVNFVHDEWQTEVPDRGIAEYVASVQKDAIRQAGEDLNLLCPMSGSSDIGLTWKDTH